METPWEELSRGGKADLRRSKASPIRRTPGRNATARRPKLRGLQLPSGAFPWFPGGMPDTYMTLYVLDGLAQAARYGVEIPVDLRDRALRFVLDELPKSLEPDEPSVALMLYAAYVVTSGFRRTSGLRQRPCSLAKPGSTSR